MECGVLFLQQRANDRCYARLGLELLFQSWVEYLFNELLFKSLQDVQRVHHKNRVLEKVGTVIENGFGLLLYLMIWVALQVEL
jgi:hypothetical protein